MVTLYRPPRGIRGSVLTCGPRFRIFRGLRVVTRLGAIRRPRLSAVLRICWHFSRAHSSWSRG
jgi:hypothetical protein